jgi:hypothetical protein
MKPVRVFYDHEGRAADPDDVQVVFETAVVK